MTNTPPIPAHPNKKPKPLVRVTNDEKQGTTRLECFADDQERIEKGFGKMPLEASLQAMQDLAQTCLSANGTAGLQIDEGKLNGTLALVMAIEPRDPIESMLAVQMAATHSAMMVQAGRLARANDYRLSTDSARNAMAKLARTFAMQVEALKRYRSTGQTVTVQHVNVARGGQAIVGHVSTREGAIPKMDDTTP